MNRQTVYPGQILPETSLLNLAKDGMIGVAKLASAVLGTNTAIHSLPCTPTSPATMNVQVGAGQIYSLQNIDNTAYSSLPADTVHQIMKQGVLMDAVSLSCPAPVTSGQSINYLIQATYQEVDANPTVLPYYNSSNPSQAYSGPNNSGTAQTTVRQGLCQVAVKIGVSAATGTQVTPTPDAGYTGLYVVTVANGASTITSGNIAVYDGAPFITESLVQKISQATADLRYATQTGFQQNAYSAANASGTSDAITATYSPAIAALTNGMTVFVRPSTANATTTPTFTPASGTISPLTIVKGNGLALVAGDIAGAGHWVELQYDSTLNKWVILNPATGVNVSVAQLSSISATVSSNALTATYAGGKLDFRNATLTMGTPIQAVPIGSLSLTVPTGATLGMTSAVQGRLVFLVAYNAGTPVLCVVNAAYGASMDETGLISPTTISAGATSATTIYSAAAVAANSPYRIIGACDISEATAGTWATAPVAVISAGGLALAGMSGLGYGQTWADYTGSRALATTYYNTTGRPIQIAAAIRNNNTTDSYTTIQIIVNGVTVAISTATSRGSSAVAGANAIIPPNSSYSVVLNTAVVGSGNGVLQFWSEMK